MGSTTDKIKSMANQAAGKLKQGIGRAADDPELHAEGSAQEVKGNAQQAMGDAKASVKKGAAAAKDYVDRKL